MDFFHAVPLHLQRRELVSWTAKISLRQPAIDWKVGLKNEIKQREDVVEKIACWRFLQFFASVGRINSYLQYVLIHSTDDVSGCELLFTIADREAYEEESLVGSLPKEVTIMILKCYYVLIRMIRSDPWASVCETTNCSVLDLEESDLQRIWNDDTNSFWNTITKRFE